MQIQYTPAYDLPNNNNKSKKVLHICGGRTINFSLSASLSESFSEIRKVDHTASSLYSYYETRELFFTPFAMLHCNGFLCNNKYHPTALPIASTSEIVDQNERIIEQKKLNYPTSMPKSPNFKPVYRHSSSPDSLPDQIRISNVTNSNHRKEDIKVEQVDNQQTTNYSLVSCLLISGSDQQIHLFVNNNPSSDFPESDSQKSKQNLYQPMELTDFFPELSNLHLNCCVLSMEIKYYKNTRIIVFGFQDGSLRLFLSKIKRTALEGFYQITETQSFKTFIDGPISSISLFSPFEKINLADYPNTRSHLPSRNHFLFDLLPKTQFPLQINLLVCSPVGYAIVYNNILESGLGSPLYLENSDLYDSITCSTTLYLPGSMVYIILGTYSGHLLFYSCDEDNNYQFKFSQQIPFPILALKTINFRYDNACSLLVYSFTGLHYYELSQDYLQNLILTRLQFFEEFVSLQAEINSHV